MVDSPQPTREPRIKVFTAFITDPKTGERRYARDEGKRCFCIWVKVRK